MIRKMHISDQKGFTLLEVIAVLIILGILLAIAIPRIFNAPEDAAESALKVAVVELNARENLAWGKWKSDRIEYTVNDIKSDLMQFTVNDDNTIISSDNFRRQAVVLRMPPSDDSPGHWKIEKFIN